jgi:hypothetical protein
VAAEQRNGMISVLNQIIDVLNERDRRHKEQFLDRQLSAVMNESDLGYALEKIYG